MSLIGWLITQAGATFHKYRYDKKRAELLASIREKYPDCTFSDKCKIHQSIFGSQVTILPGAIVKKSRIEDYVVLHAGVRVVAATIGCYTYISPSSIVSHVKIGKYCSIGKAIYIGLPSHPSRAFISTYPAFFSENNHGCLKSFVADQYYDDSPKDTLIGNDVWIGNNVIIPGGVSIGDGAIVAAGSVVVKDVSPYAIVGGNPAQLIRYRFDKDEIDFLLQVEWWNWPDKLVRNSAHSFDSISAFRRSVEMM